MCVAGAVSVTLSLVMVYSFSFLMSEIELKGLQVKDEEVEITCVILRIVFHIHSCTVRYKLLFWVSLKALENIVEY